MNMNRLNNIVVVWHGGHGCGCNSSGGFAIV